MDLTNSLFTDTILLILSCLKYFEQDSLAITCKPIYKQYCNYKADLLKFEKEVKLNLSKRQEDLLIFVCADGTIQRKRLHITHGHNDSKIGTSDLLRDNSTIMNDVIYSFATYRNNHFPEEIIGFIDCSSLYKHHWVNCYLYKSIVIDYYDLPIDGVMKNIINMGKYNKLKSPECPNVIEFTHYTTLYYNYINDGNDGEPLPINITKFNHSQTSNYCSILQCVNEMLSLHDFFTNNNDPCSYINDEHTEYYKLSNNAIDYVGAIKWDSECEDAIEFSESE